MARAKRERPVGRLEISRSMLTITIGTGKRARFIFIGRTALKRISDRVEELAAADDRRHIKIDDMGSDVER